MAAWGTLTLLDGYDAIVYVQAAGVTAAPGTADELGWITDVSLTNETETVDKGPHINRSTITKRRGGKTREFSFTVDMASGTQVAKDRMSDAYDNDTDVKVTVQVAPTTGEKWVYDDSIVTTYNVEGSAADGWTCEMAGSSATYTHTKDAS